MLTSPSASTAGDARTLLLLLLLLLFRDMLVPKSRPRGPPPCAEASSGLCLRDEDLLEGREEGLDLDRLEAVVVGSGGAAESRGDDDGDGVFEVAERDDDDAEGDAVADRRRLACSGVSSFIALPGGSESMLLVEGRGVAADVVAPNGLAGRGEMSM